LGTEHHELYLNEEECLDIMLKLPVIYDEPFAQPSAIPTYLVSKLARQDVTVAISGDGGDEMFAGYARDWTCPAKYQKRVNNEEQVPNFYEYLTMNMFKRQLFQDDILVRIPDERCYLDKFGSWKINDSFNRALHFEATTFMESETLVKVDRASMANSLEVREPFLDPQISKFAFCLPKKYKYDENNTGKVILRKVLSRYLPEEMFNLPKRGFHIPMRIWMFGERFRHTMQWAFDENTLSQSGIFHSENVRTLLQRESKPYSSGGVNVLYNILILQLWLREKKII
jgi:asparagine synthase (glutamine-hydrolysing)